MACRDANRRLPTPAEPLTLERTGRLTVEEVSGEIDGGSSGVSAITIEPNDTEFSFRSRTDTFAFHCVAEPKR